MLGLSITWAKNFQMSKLGLEKSEEPEIKYQHSLDSRESKGIPEKHLPLFHWLCQSLWLCVSWQTVGSSQRDGITRPSYLFPKKSACGQEATVRALYGTSGFRTEKGVQQGYLLSPYLFNLYAAHIMRNARLDELQAGIKIGERNINNPRCADDTTLMAESKKELKNLLMRVKEESEKARL